MPVSEEFVEFLSEGAVAIEVYGHKQANPRRNLALWDLGVIQAKTRSLRERLRLPLEIPPPPPLHVTSVDIGVWSRKMEWNMSPQVERGDPQAGAVGAAEGAERGGRVHGSGGAPR